MKPFKNNNPQSLSSTLKSTPRDKIKNNNTDNDITLSTSINQNNAISLLPSYLNEAFDSVEGVYHYLSTLEKIELFAKTALDASKPSSTQLGALIAIYLFITKNKELNNDIIHIVLRLCLDILRSYTKYNELFLIAAIDIITRINDNLFIDTNTDLITLFLTDINFPILQASAFNCFFHNGYDGLKTLINVCKKYTSYQKFILARMLETPHIQHIIIVRGLINEFYTKDSKRINMALAALNRLYWVVRGEDNVEFAIVELFDNPKINKNLIASTLRTSGELGLKMICGLAINHRDFSVRNAICKSLGHTIIKEKMKFLNLKLTFTKPEYDNKKSPLVKYRGSDISVCSNEYDYNDDNSYLEVNADEFLASLTRMLTLEYNHENPILTQDRNLFNSLYSYSKLNLPESSHKLYPLCTHLQDIEPQIENEFKSYYLISNEIVSTLIACTKDKQSLVRASAVKSLGQLSKTNCSEITQKAINPLIFSLNKEKDESVISEILLSLSNFDLSSHKNEINRLINKYLPSQNSSISQATLSLIPQMKNTLSDYSIETLKQFILSKEVSKCLYAKALLLSGEKGENILIRLMNKDDVKLQANIASAFAFADPNSSNIDFITEALLNKKGSTSQLVRKNVNETLGILGQYRSVNVNLQNFVKK